MLDVSPRACAVIGDQLFTDILGAKLSGMRSVLLEPIQEEEAGLLALKRRLERPYRKKYMKNRSDKEP